MVIIGKVVTIRPSQYETENVDEPFERYTHCEGVVVRFDYNTDDALVRIKGTDDEVWVTWSRLRFPEPT